MTCGCPLNTTIAFLFSDPDVGVQFLKDVGLLEAAWCAVSVGRRTGTL
jgi:hypothetical protein